METSLYIKGVELPTSSFLNTNYLSKTNSITYTPTAQYNPATKKYVDDCIAAINQLHFEIVEELPQVGEPTIIYMILADDGEGEDYYDEYIYINDTWEKIGSTRIDLTPYATKVYVDTAATAARTPFMVYVSNATCPQEMKDNLQIIVNNYNKGGAFQHYAYLSPSLNYGPWIIIRANGMRTSGSYKYINTRWELWVEGTDASGNRVYKLFTGTKDIKCNSSFQVLDGRYDISPNLSGTPTCTVPSGEAINTILSNYAMTSYVDAHDSIYITLLHNYNSYTGFLSGGLVTLETDDIEAIGDLITNIGAERMQQGIITSVCWADGIYTNKWQAAGILAGDGEGSCQFDGFCRGNRFHMEVNINNNWGMVQYIAPPQPDLSKVAGFINLYNYSSSNPLVLSTLEPGLYILSGTGFSGASLTMVARPGDRSTTIFDFDLSKFAYLLIQEKIPEVYDRRRTAYIVMWGINQGYYTLTDDGYSLTHQWSLSKEFLTASTNQTITGKKTFNQLPESSITPTTNNQLVNKKYIDDSLNSIQDTISKFKVYNLYPVDSTQYARAVNLRPKPEDITKILNDINKNNLEGIQINLIPNGYGLGTGVFPTTFVAYTFSAGEPLLQKEDGALALFQTSWRTDNIDAYPSFNKTLTLSMHSKYIPYTYDSATDTYFCESTESGYGTTSIELPSTDYINTRLSQSDTLVDDWYAVGRIKQYTGETTSNLTKGYFYQENQVETTDPETGEPTTVLSWDRVDVQPRAELPKYYVLAHGSYNNEIPTSQYSKLVEMVNYYLKYNSWPYVSWNSDSGCNVPVNNVNINKTANYVGITFNLGLTPAGSNSGTSWGISYRYLYGGSAFTIYVKPSEFEDGEVTNVYSDSALQQQTRISVGYSGGGVARVMAPSTNLPLGTTNTVAFTPTGDYNPATKKYVDDSIPKIVALTQSEYDALDPPDPDTYYFIKEN